MEFNNISLITSGDLAELIFLTIITGVFFTGRRVWLLVEHNKKPAGGKVIMKGIVVCIVSGILSYTLDPFLIQIHPRLSLLLPTILGLWGEKFIDISINIKKLIKFIRWIKALYEGKEDEGDPDIFDAVNVERHKDLLDQIISLRLEIEDALVEYHERKDGQVILDCYKNTTKKVAMINFEIGEESQDDLEPIVKQKVQELYSTNDLLMDARREILYKDKDNNENNTST